MNRYFVQNPDMVLGEMQTVSGPYGPETACVPYGDQSLGDLLSAAENGDNAAFITAKNRVSAALYELADGEKWGFFNVF